VLVDALRTDGRRLVALSPNRAQTLALRSVVRAHTDRSQRAWRSCAGVGARQEGWRTADRTGSSVSPAVCATLQRVTKEAGGARGRRFQAGWCMMKCAMTARDLVNHVFPWEIAAGVERLETDEAVPDDDAVD
jgi:hypothetical protein